MRKTITVLTISIMLATNSMAGLFTPDSVAKIEKTTDNAIAILNDTTAIAGNDTKSFDMPEYMYQEIDSMLNCWQARNLLNKLNTPVDTTENIKISDTIYAERLQSMPTIVKMPYNRVVRSCIDSYTTKNRSLVAYLLGISEFYMPIIEEEIDRAGIPHELK